MKGVNKSITTRYVNTINAINEIDGWGIQAGTSRVSVQRYNTLHEIRYTDFDAVWLSTVHSVYNRISLF
jgi:hypothetical protein